MEDLNELKFFGISFFACISSYKCHKQEVARFMECPQISVSTNWQ